MKEETRLKDETADNLLMAIAGKAQEVTGAETAVVALAENEAEAVHYAEAVGKHADWVRGRRGAAATSGLCGTAFKGYSPVLVCNTAGDDRVRQDHAQMLGITTALATPLYYENRLLGALLLFNKADGSEFDTTDEAALNEYMPTAAAHLADYLAHHPNSAES